MQEFTDSKGEVFKLYPEIRDYLKVDWKEMFAPFGDCEVAGEATKNKKKEAVKDTVELFSRIGYSLKGKRILEIGCHHGYVSYLFGEIGSEVVGIDIPEYGLLQNKELLNDPRGIERERNKTKKSRELLSKDFSNEVVNRVSFQELDACKMSFDNEFDVIISTDVLEHIQDTQSLFRNMHRALKKNGVMFHFFNPFFSMSGGHSLCTLDFR